MSRSDLKPALMGGLMGLMMLAMLHQMMIGQSDGSALLVFVLAHAVILAAALVGAVFAARLSPRLRHLLGRLHRPSARHLASMAFGLIGAMALAHLILHKGLL